MSSRTKVFTTGVGIAVVLLILSAYGLNKSGLASFPGVGNSVTQPTGIDTTQMAQLIPVAVSSLAVDVVPKGIAIKWSGTGQDDIQYHISRSVSGTENWQKLANVKIVEDNRGQYTYIDTTVKPGITYVYGVRTATSYGKESTL